MSVNNPFAYRPTEEELIEVGKRRLKKRGLQQLVVMRNNAFKTLCNDKEEARRIFKETPKRVTLVKALDRAIRAIKEKQAQNEVDNDAVDDIDRQIERLQNQRSEFAKRIRTPVKSIIRALPAPASSSASSSAIPALEVSAEPAVSTPLSADASENKHTEENDTEMKEHTPLSLQNLTDCSPFASDVDGKDDSDEDIFPMSNLNEEEKKQIQDARERARTSQIKFHKNLWEKNDLERLNEFHCSGKKNPLCPWCQKWKNMLVTSGQKLPDGW